MGVRNNFPWWVNRFAVVAILFVAWIFLIATTAAPAWGKGTVFGGNYHSGLWSSCSGSACSSVDESSLSDCAKSGTKSCQEIMASRAFLVLAVLLVSFALILSILQCIGYFNSLNGVTTIMTIIAFVFTLIGWAIGVDAFVTTNGMTADACVGLGVIVLVLLGGAIYMNHVRDYDDIPLANKHTNLNNNVSTQNNNTVNNNNNAANVQTV